MLWRQWTRDTFGGNTRGFAILARKASIHCGPKRKWSYPPASRDGAYGASLTETVSCSNVYDRSLVLISAPLAGGYDNGNS